MSEFSISKILICAVFSVSPRQLSLRTDVDGASLNVKAHRFLSLFKVSSTFYRFISKHNLSAQKPHVLLQRDDTNPKTLMILYIFLET